MNICGRVYSVKNARSNTIPDGTSGVIMIVTTQRQYFGGLLPLVCFLLLTSVGQSRDPWLTQTGLTGDQVSSRTELFLDGKLGIAPLQISGYNDHGSELFSLLWGPTTEKTPRRIVTGVNAGGLGFINAFYQADGWNLAWLNGYHFEGEDFYAAIYRKGGSEQILDLGLSASGFSTAREAHQENGYYLENFCTFRTGNGAIRYGGFWNKGGHLSPLSRLDQALTSAELDNLVGSLASQWRIHNLCGYASGSTVRYDVMWRRPARSGFLYHTAMSSLNFHAQNTNYIGIGWRPAFLQAWSQTSTDVRYNALWVPNDGLDYSYIDQINNLVTSAMASNNIPALSLAISHEGRLIFNRAYGWADYGANRWAGANHRFRLASVAKAITGLAVVHGLENSTGRGLNLDSTVFGDGALFGEDFGTPPYSTREQAVTIRDLLLHVAGWPNDGNLWYHSETSWGSDNAPVISWQLDNVTQSSFPGTTGRYSNLGYVMAARAAEYIGGQGFENYVANKILTPSGATGAYRPVVGDRTQAQRKFEEVTYYTGPTYGDPTVTFDPYQIDPRRMDGSTAWVARPSDLLLVSRRVDGDPRHADIINNTSRMALLTPGPAVPATGYNSSNYGLGWFPRSTYVGHNGAMAGSRAEWMMESGQNAYAWASNTLGGMSNTTLQNIINSIDSADAWPELDLFGIYHPYYQDWLTGHFALIEWQAIGMVNVLWGPGADPDCDGLSNGLECYLGLDPREFDESPFRFSIVNGTLRVRWYRSTTAQGIVLGYQASDDLIEWDEGTEALGDVQGSISPIGYQLQEVSIPLEVDKGFVRFTCEMR
jgi:D-alanyl-D-alanine carboxypeptidase